jgi:hypothetical protein
MMQGLPARTGWIAAAVSFVGVMMVFAHIGFLKRPPLAALVIAVVPVFSKSSMSFRFR